MERILDDELTGQLQAIFTERLREPVGLIFFESADTCEYCAETRQLLEEVVALTDRVTLQTHRLEVEGDLAAQYHVDKTPGLVITALNGTEIVDYGIRYAGIPAGHEFTSLINDILLVSARDSGLNEATRAFLKGLSQEVKLQVFVTPSCPYCPASVNQAHAMAFESPWIQAEMIEATEFPDLSDRFNVSGVPQTTINDGRGTVVGSGPEEVLIEEIRKSLQA